MIEKRDGEVALPNDPATQAGDAHVVFIGTVRSAWTRREDCPKNMREARERSEPATVEILPAKSGCRLTLSHTGLPRAQLEQMENRWTGMLYGLATLVSQ